MMNSNLNTWNGIDISKIEKVYEEIKPLVALEMCNSETRIKLKGLMEKQLPEYKIKCDEENNPPERMISHNIVVRVSLEGTNNYVDVIF